MSSLGYMDTESLLERGLASNTAPNALPRVDNPDQAFANITRQEYMDYLQNYRGFEENLLNKSQTDTSLIDQARQDVTTAQGLAGGIASRTASRYGAALTPAQIQEQQRMLQRANTLGGVQSVNDARIAQREANTGLLSDLINIGQGVNRSSQSQLGSAAGDAMSRQNAFTQAKAASRAQTYGTIGQLGASALMFLALSDRSVKHSINKIGKSRNGINIYEFSYIGSSQRYQGVMADEVPWAVVKHSSGKDMVDYSKVDVEFKKASS